MGTKEKLIKVTLKEFKEEDIYISDALIMKNEVVFDQLPETTKVTKNNYVKLIEGESENEVQNKAL